MLLKTGHTLILDTALGSGSYIDGVGREDNRKYKSNLIGYKGFK